jgi:hypothetical protein
MRWTASSGRWPTRTQRQARSLYFCCSGAAEPKHAVGAPRHLPTGSGRGAGLGRSNFPLPTLGNPADEAFSPLGARPTQKLPRSFARAARNSNHRQYTTLWETGLPRMPRRRWLGLVPFPWAAAQLAHFTGAVRPSQEKIHPSGGSRKDAAKRTLPVETLEMIAGYGRRKTLAAQRHGFPTQ